MTPTIAAISLAVPAMLGGLALLGLPIVAHLLNRRARRRIVFPTIRLLRESSASQSRLFKLRRWLLLLLRCLAVACLVYAFAQPIWFNRGQAEAASGGAAAAVVILDASASAQQAGGGVAVMDELRAAAGAALDDLRDGVDVANVVISTAQPEAVFEALSPNLPALRDQLSRVEPTFERADLPGALAMAGEMLAEHGGSRRLVIVSDLQQTNWVELQQSDLSKLVPAGTRVVLLPLRAAAPENVALTDPRVAPARPLPGEPAQLVVRVANHSGRPRTVRLRATVDGRELPAQSTSLQPWERADAGFEVALERAGRHSVVFTLDAADALEADNQAFLVAEAVQRVPVLVMDDSPPQPGSGSYYLTRALAPFDSQERDRFDVRQIAGHELSAERLAEATVVLMGELAPLSQSAAESLASYVERGGGVVIFAGGGSVRENLELLERQGSELLPWLTGTERDATIAGEPLRLTDGLWSARVFRHFDERTQIALRQPSFTRVWEVDALAADARVLLRFSDGTPALVSRPAGLGHVVLANFSPAPDRSDFGKYGSFLALLHSLVYDLQPTRDVRERFVAGQPVRYVSATLAGEQAARGLRLIGPAGEPEPAELIAEPSGVTVYHPRSSRPGLYHLTRGGDETGAFAVNLDPRESDLRRIEPAIITDQFTEKGVSAQVKTAHAAAGVLELRGVPLWGWCFAVALLALAIEQVLIGVWRR